MAHVAGHPTDLKAQRKHYFKVFKYLVALTVLEVIFVYLPLPKLAITLMVVVASCAKAALVGYHYMHLKYETKWLKFVAMLPLLMFGYLAVLGPDSAKRPANAYLPEKPRFFPPNEDGDEAEHAPVAAPTYPAIAPPNADTTSTPAAQDGATAVPADPAAPEPAAPAAEDEYK